MINKALRLIRQFHGLQQRELSEKLGISKSYLSEIESGRKAVSYSLLQNYSEIFEIPTSSLVFLSETLNNDNPTKFYEKFGKAFSGKIINLLEWLVEKEEKQKA
jgi:transcriptional regulator with XRE-family HTH domain